MSYDIELVDPSTEQRLHVDKHEDGGNYVLGGTPDAWLNVTYNYSPFFYTHIDKESGIRWLYGKTGQVTAARLRRAVAELGTIRDSDYWKASAGNAGHALSILLRWAEMHPSGIWQGD